MSDPSLKVYEDAGPSMSRVPAPDAAPARRKAKPAPAAVKEAAIGLTPAERLADHAEQSERGVSLLDELAAARQHLDRVQRTRTKLQRELEDAEELEAHASTALKAAAVHADVTGEERDARVAEERQQDLTAAIGRVSNLKHQLEPKAAAEAHWAHEVARLEKKLHGAKRARVLERLQRGAPERRARLLEDLVAEALTTQLIAGVPPSDAGRICANALGEKLMAIGYQAEQLFTTLAKENDDVA